MRFSLFVIALAVCLSTSAANAKPRYVAVFRDGTTRSSDRQPDWHSTANSYFGDAPLFDEQNDALVLRDRQIRPRLAPPFILLANGDVLPGDVIGYEANDPRFGNRPTLYISPASPLETLRSGRIAVRADRVARIVTTSSAPATGSPSVVVLRDGRQIAARSLRLTPSGITLLSAEGVVTAGFPELADVSFAIDRLQAVIEDGIAIASNAEARVVRLTSQDGAALTSTQAIRYIERQRPGRGRRGFGGWDLPRERSLIVLQPAWSLEPLCLLESLICQSSFRAANELPLSLLAAETLAERGTVGRAMAWRRSSNVRGEQLASGDLEADHGIGAHAHSEIAFDLPPAAKMLSLWVGLDRASGDGGCVNCQVRRDKADGAVLWDSGMLQGSNGPQQIGPLDIEGIRRLVLISQTAHEGRPSGADPLDIRDDVAWLSPLVTIDGAAVLTPSTAAGLLAGASAWQLDAADLKSSRFTNMWNGSASRWDPVVRVSSEERLDLSRRIALTPFNDVVEFVTAAPLRSDDHRFELTIDGRSIPRRASADRLRINRDTDLPPWVRVPNLRQPREAPYDDSIHYWWDLQAYRGKEVHVVLSLQSPRDIDITWRSLALRSAVSNLPASGKLPAPDVPLAQLKPPDANVNRVRDPLLDRLPGGDNLPITFLGQVYRGGYGMMRSSVISFDLKPEYRRFVALGGTCTETSGPLRVLVDGHPIWEQDTRPATAGAEWIDLVIPAGGKKITLETGPDGGYRGYSAFANAGFMK